MTTTKRKPKVIHYCTQEDTIKKMNYLLVGNGKPEEGLLFKVDKFFDDHKDVVLKIGEIKTTVEGLGKKVDDAKDAAVTASNALEKYKDGVKKFEEGKKTFEEAVRIKRNLAISRILQVCTILIALFMAYLGYRNLNKGQKKTQQEVNGIRYELAPTRSLPMNWDKIKNDTTK